MTIVKQMGQKEVKKFTFNLVYELPGGKDKKVLSF